MCARCACTEDTRASIRWRSAAGKSIFGSYIFLLVKYKFRTTDDGKVWRKSHRNKEFYLWQMKYDLWYGVI